MSFADLTLERYSCRKYERRAVEPEKLDAILEAGRLAPTACNNHPVRVLPCTTPELLEKAAASGRLWCCWCAAWTMTRGCVRTTK